jgi:hypothetical protein
MQALTYTFPFQIKVPCRDGATHPPNSYRRYKSVKIPQSETLEISLSWVRDSWMKLASENPVTLPQIKWF